MTEKRAKREIGEWIVSATLAGIMPALTLAFMLRTTHRDARTLLTTYLGQHAADRVLAGNIVRGRAEAIRAVVWFSDLVGFTPISDTVSPDKLLELLNDYAQAQVEARIAGRLSRAPWQIPRPSTACTGYRRSPIGRKYGNMGK